MFGFHARLNSPEKIIDNDRYDSLALAAQVRRTERKNFDFLLSMNTLVADEPSQNSNVREALRALRPTHPLRHRALSNQVKSRLLGAAHDPRSDQFAELEQLAKDTAKKPRRGQRARAGTYVKPPDARTLQSWWLGEVGTIHTKSKVACDRIAPGSRAWTENSRYGDPAQRHMDALDVRFDDSLTESADRFAAQLQSRFEMLDKCLHAVDKCWAVFTSAELPDLEARNLVARMAPGGQVPEPLIAFPSLAELNALATSAGQVNGHAFDIHPSVRNLHNAANKFGVVESLVRVGVLQGDADPSPWWHRGLIFDLASVASLGVFFALFGPRGSPSANVGDSWMLISTVNRVFFDHEELATDLLAKTAPILAGRMRLPTAVFVAFLCGARETYYRHLSAIGISFEDVYAVTRPDMPTEAPATFNAM